MIPATFHIDLQGDSIVSGPLTIPIEDPEEPVLAAITRAYAAAHGARGQGAFSIGIVRWTPTDGSGDYLMVSVGSTTTAQRFYDAFGPLATADPPALSLQIDGIGGDGDLADLLGEVVKVYKIVKGVLSIADWIRFQEHRREVEDWQDTGVVTMRLRQLVLAEARWEPSEFTRRFAIDGSERGRLLRTVGYEREPRGGARLWIEIEPE